MIYNKILKFKVHESHDYFRTIYFNNYYKETKEYRDTMSTFGVRLNILKLQLYKPKAKYAIEWIEILRPTYIHQWIGVGAKRAEDIVRKLKMVNSDRKTFISVVKTYRPRMNQRIFRIGKENISAPESKKRLKKENKHIPLAILPVHFTKDEVGGERTEYMLVQKFSESMGGHIINVQTIWNITKDQRMPMPMYRISTVKEEWDNHVIGTINRKTLADKKIRTQKDVYDYIKEVKGWI